MRLIALFLFLLLPPSYAGQVFSSLEAVENKNTTLISNAAVSDEKIIQTVTASGYGTSVDAAAQNAAENALTQVVGSFIDAETQIKKQKEIRDGVISKTKVIKKDIRDYSQGSIKYFEVLNVQQNGAIYNVTARVDVRVEDFRAYIKELAFESKKINQGLFSSIKTDEDNIENKLDLLGKIINPLINAEVIDINIGTPQRLEELSAFGCKFDKVNTQIRGCNHDDSNSTSNAKIRNFSVKGSLVIPITFDIKKDYLENTIKILDNISEHRQSKSGKYDYRIDSSIYNSTRDHVMNIINTKSKSYIRYIIPNTREYNTARIRAGSKKSVPIFAYRRYECDKHYPKLRLQFINSKKESIWQKDFSSCYGLDIREGREGFSAGIKTVTTYLKDDVTATSPEYLQMPRGRLYNDLVSNDRRHPGIYDQSRMLLIIEPSNELMNSIQEVTLQYIQI